MRPVGPDAQASVPAAVPGAEAQAARLRCARSPGRREGWAGPAGLRARSAGRCPQAVPARAAMCAAVPGYSPGFKKPPEMLRLKRKRLRRSEVAAPGAAAARSPAREPGPRPFPGRRNPFSSLDNAPRPAPAPRRPPPGASTPHPLWQVPAVSVCVRVRDLGCKL